MNLSMTVDEYDESVKTIQMPVNYRIIQDKEEKIFIISINQAWNNTKIIAKLVNSTTSHTIPYTQKKREYGHLRVIPMHQWLLLLQDSSRSQQAITRTHPTVSHQMNLSKK